MERTTGTFQDRLVTELRIAGVSTIDGANRVLPDFLPRFNERFRVPAQQPDVAYRSLDADLCLDRSLCFKHSRRVARDNTVKYRWHTLQLLPGMERPSYAGAKVEVQEGLDGTLRVQHEGPLSLHRKRRHVRVSCGASTGLPRTLLPRIRASAALAAI